MGEEKEVNIFPLKFNLIQFKYPREHGQCIEVSSVPTTANWKRLRDHIILFVCRDAEAVKTYLIVINKD